jgi:hypothetical protein
MSNNNKTIKLHFQTRTQYGKQRFYPMNEEARFILELMEVKSVSLDYLKRMKDHGWEIEIEQEKIEI